MSRIKSSKFLKAGIAFVVAAMILTMVPSAVTANQMKDTGSDVMLAEGGNVTAMVIGGPGYFIRVTNDKNITVNANVKINFTSSFADEEFIHCIEVLPGHSSVVYKLGGFLPYIFAWVSAEVSVDSEVISSRTGFLILGLIIFTTG